MNQRGHSEYTEAIESVGTQDGPDSDTMLLAINADQRRREFRQAGTDRDDCQSDDELVDMQRFGDCDRRLDCDFTAEQQDRKTRGEPQSWMGDTRCSLFAARIIGGGKVCAAL